MPESTTSVDLSEFYGEFGRSGTKCAVGVCLRALDSDKATRLRAALAAVEIPTSAIARTMKRWDVPLFYNSLRRHRAGGCHCA